MSARRLLVTFLPGYGHFHPLLPLTLAHGPRSVLAGLEDSAISLN